MKISKVTKSQREATIARKERLILELEKTLPFCRGSLHKFRIKKKGKDNGSEYRTYYNWERIINGKKVSRTVRLDQVEYIRAGISRYRAFKSKQRALESVLEAEYFCMPEWLSTDVSKKKTKVSKKSSSFTRGIILKKL